ncbi:MAG: hypothetical protein GY791_11270 [Alphaproteobacteria bacterium]|nr:hypothetical protein [Alphaproteobacteria bacterium]
MWVAVNLVRVPLLAALAVVGAAAVAHGQSSSMAAASPWVTTDQTEVRLVAATTATGETDTVQLGLQFKLIPNWKVYWRNPGAAGFPPSIDWAGSDNLADSVMRWPAPKRFSVLGLDTLGYKDEVVFPISVALQRPGDPLTIAARVNYLTCDEICVPYEADLALSLPSGSAFPTPYAQLLDRFAAQVPGDGAAVGMAVNEATIVGHGGAQLLRVAASADPPFSEPDLYVEAPDRFEFGAPTLTFADDRREAVFEIDVSTIGKDSADLAGKDITLTVVDGSRAMEVPVPAVTGTDGGPTLGTLLGILGLALAGGLILNLMPCVLPVLSLKLLSVVKHGGGAPGDVRAGFLATAAGIVFSFLVIGVALIVVKSAGMAVGWGIQFQQPVFLAVMTLILTLFAANLWGLFEIRLPGGISDRFSTPGHDTSLRGHFLTGAFATLLATPCSAPFLGSAVGFALSRGAIEIIAVFLVLGLGLAIPYLAVATFPALATRLPRPGPWMAVLRRILGAALAGTGLWLLSVLAAQVGASAAVATLAAMVAIVALLWLGRRLVPPAGAVAWVLALVVAGLAVAGPAIIRDRPIPATAASGEPSAWTPFAAGRISDLVRDGKVVFVDVTADWCLTCKVNKSFVLDTEPVAGELGSADVVAMLADWTRPDDAIADYLARFGRYGIPFNAVYGPGAPRGLPLPELLTSDAVMNALRRARAGG